MVRLNICVLAMFGVFLIGCGDTEKSDSTNSNEADKEPEKVTSSFMSSSDYAASSSVYWKDFSQTDMAQELGDDDHYYNVMPDDPNDNCLSKIIDFIR